MPISFSQVRFETAPELLPELAAFYGATLDLGLVPSAGDGVAVAVGETAVEFLGGHDHPYYHFALLLPGDRFAAAHRWLAERVAILPDESSGAAVFEFEHWDAQALYFHDPAGSIVELIAHRGVGESGVTGRFHPRELLGLSEVGLVGAPERSAEALADTLDLVVWSGSATEAGRLAFVGEKARTLILAQPGRAWLPTGRAAEAYPVEVVITGVAAEEVQLGEGIVVRGAATVREG